MRLVYGSSLQSSEGPRQKIPCRRGREGWTRGATAPSPCRAGTPEPTASLKDSARECLHRGTRGRLHSFRRLSRLAWSLANRFRQRAAGRVGGAHGARQRNFRARAPAAFPGLGCNVFDMSTMLPLFPLSTVLFPGMRLPLHIFEERYRLLAAHLAARPEPRRFGVIAIRKGREVGADGITALHEVGCVTTVRQITPHPDG